MEQRAFLSTFIYVLRFLLTKNDITDTINIFQRKICIQRQGQHTQCQMLCHRSFLCSSSRIVTITLKNYWLADRKYFLAVMPCSSNIAKDFITSILISVEKQTGKVRIVTFHIFLNSTKLDSFYTRQTLAITLYYFLLFAISSLRWRRLQIPIAA